MCRAKATLTVSTDSVSLDTIMKELRSMQTYPSSLSVLAQKVKSIKKLTNKGT